MTAVRLDFSPLPPPMMLDEVAEGGRGAAIRDNIANQAIARIAQSIAKNEPIEPILADGIGRIPKVMLRWSKRAPSCPHLLDAYKLSPIAVAAAAANDFEEWRNVSFELLKRHPEALHHFLVLGEPSIAADDLAVFVDVLRLNPFWWGRTLQLCPKLMPFQASIDIQDDDMDPYRRFHYLVTHQSVARTSSWRVLFSTPTTSILAARWLAGTDFPWDYLPVGSLSPRAAYNLLGLWPSDRPFPDAIWEALALDPEWFVLGWRRMSTRAPKGGLVDSLLNIITNRHASNYIFGSHFAKWWAVNAAPRASSQNQSSPIGMDRKSQQ